MGLGNEIIAELGRRRLTGQYFDFAGYKKLRQVENSEALCQFLLDCDYQSPPQLKSAKEAADYLVAVNQRLVEVEAQWFWAGIVLGAVVPFVDFFCWLCALILRLNRGSRKRL